MCEPCLEVDVYSLSFFFFKFLDNWGHLNMNLALGNVQELFLMLLDNIMAFGYIRNVSYFIIFKDVH